MRTLRLAVAGGTLCALSLPAAASCGAAFCLVNTDWSVQGTWTDAGVRGDLRYEHIDLDKPRSGTHGVSVGEIPRDHDEVETRNRNIVGSLDFGVAPGWGVNVSLPWVDRYHLHIHHDEPGDAGEPETWNFRKLGDIRVQARHELFADINDPAIMQSAGFTAGVKLPTGSIDVVNGEGERAERTLQPGTGTTDLVGGAWWHLDTINGHSWFVQAQVQLPMNSRESYKPGPRFQLDGGYRYALGPTLGILAQVNYLAKGRDSGEQAEPEDSGQRMLYFSPGISWNAARNAQVYAFVQAPLYQAMNGVQLSASWSAAAGVSWRF